MACLTPWDKQTARVFDTEGAFHALFANSDKSGLARDAVLTIRKRKKKKGLPPSGGRLPWREGDFREWFTPFVRHGNGLF